VRARLRGAIGFICTPFQALIVHKTRPKSERGGLAARQNEGRRTGKRTTRDALCCKCDATLSTIARLDLNVPFRNFGRRARNVVMAVRGIIGSWNACTYGSSSASVAVYVKCLHVACVHRGRSSHVVRSVGRGKARARARAPESFSFSEPILNARSTHDSRSKAPSALPVLSSRGIRCRNVASIARSE